MSNERRGDLIPDAKRREAIGALGKDDAGSIPSKVMIVDINVVGELERDYSTVPTKNYAEIKEALDNGYVVRLCQNTEDGSKLYYDVQIQTGPVIRFTRMSPFGSTIRYEAWELYSYEDNAYYDMNDIQIQA